MFMGSKTVYNKRRRETRNAGFISECTFSMNLTIFEVIKQMSENESSLPNAQTGNFVFVSHSLQITYASDVHFGS
jgi:hypothetical protein